jgi:tRNA-2-methylthio-N6-dimethylallyladenosine synthase
LLEELNQIKGLQRLRFLTNHPKDMSERLINAIARLDKVCEQINLPVQAGHDEILAAMCRGYSLEKYKGLVRDLRAAVPGISITTDIIVGFPGEKDYHIKATLELLQELCFDAVHIAMYSARPQTMASARYQDDITADIKQQRRRQAEALQAAIATEINRQYKGLNTEVLVEGRKKGKWYGRNRNDKLVFFEHNKNWLGKLVDVKINKTTAWSLSGTLAGDEK